MSCIINGLAILSDCLGAICLVVQKMLIWALSLFALILECRCALHWNLTDLFLLDLELINL